MQIKRNSPVPLHYQLSETLRASINSGQFQAGSKLPTENELCEKHGVSRSVVRQALQSLAHEGLIGTERGRGAFVRERKVPIALVQNLDPLEESMEKAGFRLTTRILRNERISAPDYIAEHLGTHDVILLERLRFADGVVFLLVRNYLPYPRFPELHGSDELEGASLYQVLADRYGAVATTGEREIELTRVDDDAIAAHLHIDPSGYVLFNREITRDQNGTPLEYYESWHHPERTRLRIRVQRA